ncbi:unnamed protein product [Cochlearia groenlandica]
MLQKPPYHLFISDNDDDNDHDNNLRYTSLKDVISSSDGFGSFISNNNNNQHCVPSSSQEGFEIDSSNIAISNELVKRAASMYLQSSMYLQPSMISAPDTNWFERFCLKAVNAVDCLRPFYRIFAWSS